jgi:hypothetical protein
MAINRWPNLKRSWISPGEDATVSLSISPILLCGSIDIDIGDTFFGCIAIDYRRYFGVSLSIFSDTRKYR